MLWVLLRLLLLLLLVRAWLILKLVPVAVLPLLALHVLFLPVPLHVGNASLQPERFLYYSKVTTTALQTRLDSFLPGKG